MSAITIGTFAGLESGTARLARIEVFGPGEVAVAHVVNRFVRCCFLFGDDLVSGKNFDHRKVCETGSTRMVQSVTNFRKRFFRVAGDPATINTTQSRLIQHRYDVPRETRKIFHEIKRPATT